MTEGSSSVSQADTGHVPLHATPIKKVGSENDCKILRKNSGSTVSTSDGFEGAISPDVLDMPPDEPSDPLTFTDEVYFVKQKFGEEARVIYRASCAQGTHNVSYEGKMYTGVSAWISSIESSNVKTEDTFLKVIDEFDMSSESMTFEQIEQQLAAQDATDSTPTVNINFPDSEFGESDSFNDSTWKANFGSVRYTDTSHTQYAYQDNSFATFEVNSKFGGDFGDTVLDASPLFPETDRKFWDPGQMALDSEEITIDMKAPLPIPSSLESSSDSSDSSEDSDMSDDEKPITKSMEQTKGENIKSSHENSGHAKSKVYNQKPLYARPMSPDKKLSSTPLSPPEVPSSPLSPLLDDFDDVLDSDLQNGAHSVDEQSGKLNFKYATDKKISLPESAAEMNERLQDNNNKLYHANDGSRDKFDAIEEDFGNYFSDDSPVEEDDDINKGDMKRGYRSDDEDLDACDKGEMRNVSNSKLKGSCSDDAVSLDKVNGVPPIKTVEPTDIPDSDAFDDIPDVPQCASDPFDPEDF